MIPMVSIAVPTLISFMLLCTSVADDPAATIQKLTQDLTSQSVETRRQAAAELTNRGPKAKTAVAALGRSLKDKDAEVRSLAATALGAIGESASIAVPALIEATKDASPDVRAHAIHSLGLVGVKSEPVIKALALAITDKEATVRRAAALSMRELKPDRNVSIPLMAKVLDDAEPAVVLPALDTITELGESAVPALIECVERGGRARYWGCVVLSELGPVGKAAAPALAAAVKDADAETRMHALLALAAIGAPSHDAAGNAIADSLADKEPRVRNAAHYAAGRVGVTKAVPAFEASLKSDDPLTVVIAAWALAKLKPDDAKQTKSSVEIILGRLRDDRSPARVAAAKAIVDLVVSSADKEIVPPGTVLTLDEEGQRLVLEAVTAQGAKAVPLLVQRLGHKESRIYAARALGRIGPGAKDAAPALSKLLAEDDVDLRHEVLIALAAIGSDAAAAVPALVESLKRNDATLPLTCYALGKIGPAATPAVTQLQSFLDRPDAWLRVSASVALVRIRPDDRATAQKALPILSRGLADEQEHVRLECAIALVELGAAAKSAVPSLRMALEDTSPSVRQAAKNALTGLGEK
jgi:HEAT repeat protein